MFIRCSIYFFFYFNVYLYSHLIFFVFHFIFYFSLAAPSAQSRGGGSGVRTLTRALITAGTLAVREEVEEVEDDDESDDEEDMDADYPRAPRSVRGSGRAQQQAALSPAEGLMLLPNDDTDRTLAPPELLPILARLIQDERLPIRSQYLYRLLQNIAKKPVLRDAVLRLLVCLLVEDQEAANKVVAELTDNTQTEFNISSENNNSSNEIKEDVARTHPMRAYAVPNDTLKGRKSLSQLSASRLVAVLFHLSSANVSCVYEMLCPRGSRGGLAIKIIEEEKLVKDVKEGDNEKEKGDEIVSAVDVDEKTIIEGEGQVEGVKEGAKEAGKKVVVKESVKEIQKETHKDADIEIDTDGEGTSTESLLEMLMPLFAHPNFTTNANDLSELTAFINVVSTPLEFLSESVVENRMVSTYARTRQLD